MRLDNKDIEAIAKSRVSRIESKTAMYWMVGVGAAIVAGILLVRINTLLGWGLCVAGVIAFVYYQNTQSKKANILKAQLMQEYKRESDGENQ